MSTKSTKKVKLKRVFLGLGALTQTPLSSQENKEISFTLLFPLSSKKSRPSCFCLYLDEVEPSEQKPASPISLHYRQKAAPLNKRPPTSKTWEIFGDQKSMDYLLSITNMAKYKNGCQYFYRCLVLIAHGFSINEFKNIFNVTLSQFLEDDKEYNQKTTYRIFENKYD